MSVTRTADLRGSLPSPYPQLCINFTNESLHNLFIEHVFKLEQQTYVLEEVPSSNLPRIFLEPSSSLPGSLSHLAVEC